MEDPAALGVRDATVRPLHGDSDTLDEPRAGIERASCGHGVFLHADLALPTTACG